MICQKCGSDTAIPIFHIGNYYSQKSPSCSFYSLVKRDAATDGEHLHYTCRCGWEWASPTKDAQP